MTRQQRLRVTMAVVAACLVLPLAYSVLGHTGHRQAPSATGPASAVHAGAREPDAGTVLQVMPAPYQLPAGLSREVVLPDAGSVLIAGGLTPSGASANTVTSLDPVTGTIRPAGRLAQATHDAAGFVVGGRMFVLGGGTDVSVPTIQAFTPGTDAVVTGALNHRRSDVSGVTAGPAGYLVGGYDGTTVDPQVLGTTDGRHFRAVARLAVPVRYAGTAAMDGLIWLFGGQATAAATAAGATDVIQRIDPATGKATVAGHLPQPVQGATAFSLDGRIYVAGGATSAGTSRTVFQFDPATSRVTSAGELPVPVGFAAAAVANGEAYLIGGEDGTRPVPEVTTFRLVAAGQPAAPWLAAASGPGRLAPGSDPAVLPADVLIADHHNNRLLIVDPQGRIRWEFPRPGDLAPGQTFLQPDDAFFSPDGKYIIVTQEDDQLVSLISVATSKIVYRYGVPGVPGAGPDHLFNPDDAMLLPARGGLAAPVYGDLLVADIKNCRIVVIAPPAHTTTRVIGQTAGGCEHDPPRRFGSPNGAFPLTDGNYLVTEINGDWANEMSLGGRVSWSAHPPGVLYPSDTNEVYPGRYLTADYSDPGQVVEFTSSGRKIWAMGGFNQPSLALPLPNGDVLLNDDFNHRVCVVDPAANRIVWQYGHTGVAGRAPGYLSDPDGVDLVPPDSLLVTHAVTMGDVP